MSRQDQTVSDGGEAYQAGQNLTVNKGISTEQMSEIMLAMANQLATYYAQAQTEAESRINDLREEILSEFSSHNTRANPDAFLDPDYQFVVKGAQDSFARNGDEWLKKELVRLLSVRSNQESGTRKAMILNEAISIAGNLTQQEYAGLAITFLIKQVKLSNIDASKIFASFNDIIVKFVDDLPPNDHAYDYLEAMRCVSINLITGVDLWSALEQNYRMDLVKGILINELNPIIGADGGLRDMGDIVVGLNHDRVKFALNSRELVAQRLSEMSYSQHTVDQILSLHDASLMTPDEVRAFVRQHAPAMREVEKVWSTTKMHQCVHTALGKALAHSALISRSTFDGPLEIWVQ